MTMIDARFVLFVATIAASLAVGLASAVASPPRTSQLLFHPTKHDLAAIAGVLVRSIEKIKFDGRDHLDVSAACAKTSPAVSPTGLGYRHIVCGFKGPGPLAVHGRVVLSIVKAKPVYRGEVCALGVCQPMRGSITG